jgi:primary-amine oxidase
MAPPHPLSALNIDETNAARDVVLKAHPGASVYFRTIALLEPPKAELTKFLDAEHSGRLSPSTPRPARVAEVKYDAIEKGSKVPVYQEAWVDIGAKKVVKHELISTEFHASLTL